ncbi:unnamed protein product, partial [Ilex paraguariensis]
DKTHPSGESGIGFSSLIQQSVGQSRFSNLGSNGPTLGLEDMYESVAQPSLRFSKTRHFAEALKAGLKIGSEANKGIISQPLIARLPAEGRGRHQLLPQYWPRITDEELQKLSRDLNSIIVSLFEKVLSASDAGQIGCLVLPKACVEAYSSS